MSGVWAGLCQQSRAEKRNPEILSRVLARRGSNLVNYMCMDKERNWRSLQVNRTCISSSVFTSSHPVCPPFSPRSSPHCTENDLTSTIHSEPPILCVHTPKWHLEEGGWLLLFCFTLHGALRILNPTGPVFRQLILDRGDLISRRKQVMVYSPCKQTQSRYFLALLLIALSDELTLKNSIKNWKKSQTHQLFSSKMSSQHFVFSCRWHLPK